MVGSTMGACIDEESQVKREKLLVGYSKDCGDNVCLERDILVLKPIYLQLK